MQKIQLSDHEKQLIVENSFKASDLVTTIVAILIMRNDKNISRDDPTWKLANDQLQELGPRITALQRCEMSPVETTGLDYVRDMMGAMQLPRIVTEYFRICNTDTEIDLVLSEEDCAVDIQLARRLKNFSIKSGITITLKCELLDS